MIYLKKYKDAEIICDKILSNNSQDATALYRKAVAQIGLNKLQAVNEELLNAKAISKANGDIKLKELIKQELMKLDIIENQINYWIIE